MSEATSIVAGALVVCGTVSAFAAIALINAFRIRKKTPEEIDLSSVAASMIEKHGWNAERAEAAKTEYLRFLTLLQKRPGFVLAPWLDANGRDDLDQFWHQHILDTAKYAADCQSLFGHMMHHNPHVARGSEVEKESIDKTRRLYARTFRTGYFGAEVEAVDLSGCSSCAAMAADTDSHSHHSAGDSNGHHGDSGHGCTGHSCGGHSCGGGH